MKVAFVIDENIIYAAHGGADAKGVESLAAVALVAEIDVNGHVLLVSEETLERYRGKLKSLEVQRSAPALNMPRVFSLMLLDENRTKKVDVSSVNVPSGIPRKDIPIVRVAAARPPCSLVTEDGALRIAIKKESLAAKGVKAVGIPDGVKEARTPDC